MIASIVYTLTSIDGINGVLIYVDGKILTTLPSGEVLPSLLNRTFGINKIFDMQTDGFKWDKN